MTDRELAVKIIEVITNSGCEFSKYFGLRKDDEILNIGDCVRNSRTWDFEIDDFGDDFENGTCCTGFGQLWFDGEEEDIETVLDAIKIQKNYKGENWYLIGGIHSHYGNDEDESVVSNATVYMVIA